MKPVKLEDADQVSEEDSEEYYSSRFTKEEMVDKIVALPFNPTWKLIVVFFVTIVYVTTTYGLVFAIYEERPSWMYVIKYTWYFVYLVDTIAAIAHRAVTGTTSRRTDRPRRMLFIFIDLITLIPIEIILVSLNKEPDALIQLLSTICVYRIFVYFIELSNTVGLNNSIVALQKFGVMYFLLIHTLSCVWYYIDGQLNWMTDPKVQSFETINSGDWYVICTIFMSGAVSILGFGNIYGHTVFEQWLSVLASIIGFTYVKGVFFGSLMTVLVESYRRHSNLWNKLQLIEGDMLTSYEHIGKSLHDRVSIFYSTFWEQKGAIRSSQLFDTLPSQMIREVNVDVYWNAINTSRLFRNIELSKKRTLAKYFESKSYMNGEIILAAKEIKTQMIYVVQGVVQVLSSEDCESPLISFSTGTCWGETGLLLSYPSSVEIRAATYCEIHSLLKKDLFEFIRSDLQLIHQICYVHKNILEEAFKNIRHKRRNEYNRVNPERALKELQIDLKNRDVRESKELPYSWMSEEEKEDLLSEEDKQALIPYQKTSKDKILDLYRLSKTTTLQRDDVCIFTHFPFIFFPESNFLMIWDGINLLVVVIVSIVFPYVAAFLRHWPENLKILRTIVDICYVADIYVQMTTAIREQGELVVTSPKKIIMRRIQQISFLIDFIAMLPIRGVCEFLKISNEPRVYVYLSLIKVLKVRKVIAIFSKVQNSHLWNNGLVQGTKYLLCFIIGSYWMGSAYFMHTCLYSDNCPNEWIRKLDNPMTFLRSLYFSLATISGTGSSDIYPIGFYEIIFFHFYYILGLVLTTYVATDFSAMLVLATGTKDDFQERAFVLRRFLEINDMLPSIKHRVDNYLSLQWNYIQGYFIINDTSLYNDAPQEISDAITISKTKEFLLKIPLFQETDPKFVEALCLTSQTYVIPPNEIITSIGETRSGFIIIVNGFCEEISGPACEKQVIGPMDYFNELEMIFEVPGFKTVKTLTHCVFIRIFKTEYDQVLAAFPNVAEENNQIMKEFSLHVRMLPVMNPQMHLKVLMYDVEATSVVSSWYVHARSTKLHVNIDYMQPFNDSLFELTRFLLLRRTIIPSGKFMISWEVLRTICAVLSGLIFPPMSYLQVVSPWLLYVGILLDVVAFIDLYIRLHVCYYNKNGILVTHPLCTAKFYLSHGFIVDLIACAPISYLLRSGQRKQFNATASFVILDILCLNRLLQLHRLAGLTSYWEKEVLNTHKYINYLKYLPITLVFITVLASLYVTTTSSYIVDIDSGLYDLTPGIGSWIERYETGLFSFSLENPWNLHLVACYWVCVSTLNVGFVHITNDNTYEMLYCVVMIILGFFVFTFMTVQIASGQVNTNVLLNVYQKRMRHLIAFMDRENVSRDLSIEVIEYFEHVWQRTRGLHTGEMLLKFHISLREDAALSLYEQTFVANPIFRGVERSFYRRLSLLVVEEYFIKGAKVITVNDIIANVFIIHQGEVEVKLAGIDLVGSLQRGSFFGSFAGPNETRFLVSVEAVVNLNLLVVSTDKFYALSEDYPKIAARIKRNNFSSNSYVSSKKMVVKKELISTKDTNVSETPLLVKLTPIIYRCLMLCSVLSCMLIMYHLAFQDHGFLVLASSYLLEILFIGRIYMGRNTVFHELTSTGNALEDISVYKKSYMKAYTGFWLDILTLIPVDIFAFAAPYGEKMFTLSILRLFHLPRIWHIVKFFNIKYERLNINMLLYALFSTSVWFTLFGHFTACLWYLVACQKSECRDDTWVKLSNCQNQYTCSVYYTATVFTTSGFGTIAPYTQIEIFYTVAFLVVGLFVIAVFIGDMSSLIVNYSSNLVKYDYETGLLKEHLKNQIICGPLVRKVLKYVQLMWSRETGEPVPVFLNEAPFYILSRVNIEAYGHHFHKNYVFSGCHIDFLRQLVVYLRRQTFFPGNFVAQFGDVDNCMYFLHQGEVDVISVSEKTEQLVDILVAGDVFGLKQGLTTNLPHDYTYQARSVIVVLSLKHEEWQYLVAFFPTVLAHLKEKAKFVLRG